MENNIPTLYILERDSFVVKSAKISTILCPFVQKFNKKSVYIIRWLIDNGTILLFEEIFDLWNDFNIANQRKGDAPSNSRASSPTLFTQGVAILSKSVLRSIVTH